MAKTFELQVSSEAEGKGRWTELELVAFEDGTFEVTVTGCSDVDGEWDMSKTKDCRTVVEVVDALRAPSGRLSHLAGRLLTEAAGRDRRFQEHAGGTDAHRDRGRGRRRQDVPGDGAPGPAATTV